MHLRLLGRPSFVVGLAALLAAYATSRAALAADPKGTPPSFASDSDADTGTPRAPAPDERTGHLVFAAAIGATGPAGALAANTPTSSVVGAGLTFGGVLGVGLGRYATLQALGDYTMYASPGTCSRGCPGTSFTVGLGVTYHIAQGIAFDPWGSFGVAYRQASLHAAAPTEIQVGGTRYAPGDPVPQHYMGIDIARIAFGGDFYPTPFFGFGPFIEADLGTNFRSPAPLLQLPPDVQPGPRAYAFFQIGVRIAFDPFRRAAPRTQAARSSAVSGGF